jgi:hypothetical protein
MRQLLFLVLIFGYITVGNYVVEQGKSVNIEGTVTLPEKWKYYTLLIQTDFEILSQSEYHFLSDENYDKKEFSFLVKVPEDINPGTYYANLILYNFDGSVLESKSVKIEVKAPSTYTDSDLIEVSSLYYKMYDDEQIIIPVKVKTKELTPYNLEVDTQLTVNQALFTFIPKSLNQEFNINLSVSVPKGLKPGKYTLNLKLYSNNSLLTSKAIIVEVIPRSEYEVNLKDIKLRDKYVIVWISVKNISHTTTKTEVYTNYTEVFVQPKEFTLKPGNVQDVEVKIPFDLKLEEIRIYVEGYTKTYIDVSIPKDFYEISVELTIPEEIKFESTDLWVPVKIKNLKPIELEGELIIKKNPSSIYQYTTPHISLQPLGSVTTTLHLGRRAGMIPGSYIISICYKEKKYNSQICEDTVLIIPEVQILTSLEDKIENPYKDRERLLRVKVEKYPAGWRISPKEVSIKIPADGEITMKDILSKFKIEKTEKAKFGDISFGIYENSEKIAEFKTKIQSILPSGHAFLFGGLGTLILIMIGIIIGAAVVYYLLTKK